MVRANTLGLMTNDPQRGHLGLTMLEGIVAAPEGLDGIGVGTCVDGSVLLSRRPTPRMHDASLADMVGALKGRCAVARLRSKVEPRPSRPSPANLGPFRWRHFACAAIGGPTEPDALGHYRENFLNELPDFLRRSVAGQTEAEAFFMAVLHELHKAGRLERLPQAKSIADAASAVLDRQPDVKRAITIATGLEVIVVSRGVGVAHIAVNGVDPVRAEEVAPTLVDSSIARERLRRFCSGIFVTSLDAIEAPSEVPDNLNVSVYDGDGGRWSVGRDLEPITL